MKRNWPTYVAIVAVLVAGTVCSTALADGKGKFGGGASRSMSGAARSFSGGGSSFKGLNSKFKSQNLSQGGLKSMQVSPGTQARTLPGGLSGVQPGKSVGGKNLTQNGLGKYAPKPEITINKNLPKTPALEQSSLVKLNNNAIQKLGPGVLSKQPISAINPNAIGKLPKLPGPAYCGPISNPCYNPCNKWCGPCWWWTPSFCTPCYTGCYYPSIYTYPTPIIVEVPVSTTVVAPVAAVAPAAAVEPVAAEAAEELLQIPVGSTITLQGKDLGDKAGQVVVQIDKISLPAQMNEWKVDSAVVTLPMIGLAGPTKAQLWMVKADGAVAANMAVELIPAQPPAADAAK